MSWWGLVRKRNLNPWELEELVVEQETEVPALEFTGFTAVGRVGAAPPLKSSVTFWPADVEVGTELPYVIRADLDPPPGPQWKYSMGEILFNKYTL